MKEAFNGCMKMQFAPTLDTPDLTNAKEMSYMFSQCTAFNQSLNTWNVSSVTSMGYTFSTCPVFNQDLNAWNVSNVANMKGLFANCTAFNQPLNGWTPIKVTNMAYMFSSCTTFNQPIGSWNMSKVGLMKSMFEEAAAFNQGTWKLKNNTRLDLARCGMNIVTYSNTLRGWATQNISSIKLDATGLKYNKIGKIERDKLEENGWQIEGDSGV